MPLSVSHLNYRLLLWFSAGERLFIGGIVFSRGGQTGLQCRRKPDVALGADLEFFDREADHLLF